MPEFEEFRSMVLGDESLQAQVRDITERSDFIAKVIELGEGHGCRFTAEDVAEAMRHSRTTGIER
jgi:hypothetical protein